MAVDFAALLLGPCIAAFGEPVVYTPQGAAPLALMGIFDAGAGVLKFEDGFEASIVKPMLGMRVADFPAGQVFRQGDAVTLRARSWLVDDIHQDSVGHVRLTLKRAT